MRWNFVNAEPRSQTKTGKKGLVIGHIPGKVRGRLQKTFGSLFRASCQGLRMYVSQFMKRADNKTGKKNGPPPGN